MRYRRSKMDATRRFRFRAGCGDDLSAGQKMSYRCVIHIKDECDGCGRCEETDERPMGYDRPYYGTLSDWDDGGNPFVPDPMDEE